MSEAKQQKHILGQFDPKNFPVVVSFYNKEGIYDKSFYSVDNIDVAIITEALRQNNTKLKQLIPNGQWTNEVPKIDLDFNATWVKVIWNRHIIFAQTVLQWIATQYWLFRGATIDASVVDSFNDNVTPHINLSEGSIVH